MRGGTPTDGGGFYSEESRGGEERGKQGGGTEQVSSASEIITKIARTTDVVNFPGTMVLKEAAEGWK